MSGEVLSVKISRVRDNRDLALPAYQSEQAAGMDLRADLDEPVTLAPGDWRLIPTGVAIALPVGFEAQVRPRSGLAAKFAVTMVNAPGTIDADYRGEIRVPIINHGREPFVIERGERIAQLIVAPVVRAAWTELDRLPDDTARGAKGFGSTGRTA